VSDPFAKALSEVGARVEAALDDILGPATKPGEIARPARLVEAMRWGALGGGKRLRPFLVIETARALGVTGEAPLKAGAAVECVHCYSLIHDDLPAMDDDELRRGRPTVHRQFDEATAILAGDALLTLAFEILGDSALGVAAETRAALCFGLARASGLAGMVGGQMLDLAAESAKAPLGADAISLLQRMKTGALLKFSVETGAILGQASPEVRAALIAYGEALGAAFQVADDILDAESTSEALGKRAGKDADRRKATFISAYGLMEAKRLRDALVDKALASLDAAGFAAEGDVLREAARFVAARKN